MAQKDFLQLKFEELNKIKTLMTVYPDDYKNIMIEKFKSLCDEIDMYLHSTRDLPNNIELTLDELKLYDGKNNMPPLIAINGTIYSVLDLKIWKNGKHFGVKAGMDLTENFAQCHNSSAEIISQLKVVGTLKQ